MRHLDPDDDKGHRRCDISYVMACRQKEVRQRNIERMRRTPVMNPMSGGVRSFRSISFTVNFMVTAGILDDEVRAKKPEHRGICDTRTACKKARSLHRRVPY